MEPLFRREQYYLEQPADAYQDVNPAYYLYQPPATEPYDTAAETVHMLDIPTSYASTRQMLCMFFALPLNKNLQALGIACLQWLTVLPEVQKLECPVEIQVVAPEWIGTGYLIVLLWKDGKQYVTLKLQVEV